MAQITHVFYIDDDPDDQEFFLLGLKEVKPGATLHSFYSCDKVIEYLKEESDPSPDIIFLDQNIRGNVDNECLQEIKKLARLEKIPVVIYTTVGSPQFTAKAINLGASKYVLKPMAINEIRENLHSIISEFENPDS